MIGHRPSLITTRASTNKALHVKLENMVGVHRKKSKGGIDNLNRKSKMSTYSVPSSSISAQERGTLENLECLLSLIIGA